MLNKIIILLLVFFSSNSFGKELSKDTREKIITNIYHRNYEQARENNKNNGQIETLITKYSQEYWSIFSNAMKNIHNQEIEIGEKYYAFISFTPDNNIEHDGVIVFFHQGKKYSVSTTKKSMKNILNSLIENYIDTSMVGNYLMIGTHNLFDKSGDRDYGISILEKTPHTQAKIILDYYKQYYQ